MKTILSVAMLFCLIATIKAREFDTVLVRNTDNNTASMILRPKTEKILFTLRFSGVSADIFSDEEIWQLEKGKKVVKKSPGAILPVSLLPNIKAKRIWTTKTYAYSEDEGIIKQTMSDVEVLGPETKESSPITVWLTILCLYMPLFGLLVVFFTSWISTEIKESRKKMLIFTIQTGLIIASAIIVGRFFGPLLGLLFGFVIGMLTGGIKGADVAGKARMVVRGNAGLSGMLAGMTSAGFGGLFAGEIAGVNFILGSPEFHILWQYLGLYVLICLLAIGLREVLFLMKEGKFKKTAVV